MCRLYTFRSNSPRKVECELIRSHNSLLSQSEHDRQGHSNPDGWGLGTYPLVHPRVVRQPRAAYESEAFRWEAARIHTKNVVAHVRRATVGNVSVENTHPFVSGDWLLAHNGTIGAFSSVLPLMLESMSDGQKRAIEGDTDSEHVFHYLLSLRDSYTDLSLPSIVARGLHQITKWSHSVDAHAELALNIILTDGRESVSVRMGRSLWYTQRDIVHPCSVCGGELHVNEAPKRSYRALAIASEPVTEDESWDEVPEGTLIHVDTDLQVVRTGI
jgi:predicted glutamine amidotransferase